MVQDYNEWMSIADAQKTGASGHDGDGCLAVFYTRPVLDSKETELQGRPIYHSMPFVQIRIPADPRSVVDERVNEDHKKRWPAAWAKYEGKETGLVDGTPIDQFPLLTVTDVATLKHCGIFTVEQLANVSDGNLGNLGPGGLKLRERAAQYLKGPDDTEKDLRAKIQRLETANSDLQAKLHQLMATIEGIEDTESEDDYVPSEQIAGNVPRRRGRPRKYA